MTKLIWASVFVAALGACSPELKKLPEVTFLADFGSPENAAIQVRRLADQTDLELRDTMVGLDGYTNFLLGQDGAVVFIAPRFDCPMPVPGSYFMKISVTPESTSGELPVATGELVRKQFSGAIRTEEEVPSCQR